ncbi:hypothetical protein JTB14_020729 [Gonioctena quinquepunctata]|nr:hypothetical protein JTB14_020729 [Gonioctena quinquepunctata]
METVPTEDHTDGISKTMNKPEEKIQIPVVRNRNKIPPLEVKGKIISQLTAAKIRQVTKEQFILEHKPRNTKSTPKVMKTG